MAKKIAAPEILQALILADSFDEKFRPITYEIPRALIPLVNVPMLDYTIEFLATSGVEEIFVFCCSHAKMISDYLSQSKWTREPGLSIKTVVAKDALNAGDALREMYTKNVLNNDFILVHGDIVSTVPLKNMVNAHKERKAKDKSCIMTIAFKKAAPSHRTRSLQDDIVVGTEGNSGRLVFLDNNTESDEVTIPVEVFSQATNVQIRYDLLDTYIDICSPEVLPLFADNFDYADIRRDFVQGVLTEQVYNQSIFTFVITGEYAARVKCLRTYDAVSKDIIHRWTYPMVPDTNLSETRFSFNRGFIYREEGVSISRYADLQQEVVIGQGTTIGTDTTISHSVIGRNCVIGNNVTIKNSYIWDDTVIENGVIVNKSIVCNKCILKEECHIEKACLISYNVTIGKGVKVPSFSKVTSFKVEHSRAIDLGKEGKGVLYINPDETLEDQRTNSLVGFEEEAKRKEMMKSSKQSTGGGDENRYLRELKDIVYDAIKESKQVDIVELNSLKFAYNVTSLDSAANLLIALVDWIYDQGAPYDKHLSIFKHWRDLLIKILDIPLFDSDLKEEKEDDLVELIYTIQECCKGKKENFRENFFKILHTLYTEKVLLESPIFEWAKQQESYEDKFYLKNCKGFLDWLRQADEEEEEEEEEEDD